MKRRRLTEQKRARRDWYRCEAHRERLSCDKVCQAPGGVCSAPNIAWFGERIREARTMGVPTEQWLDRYNAGERVPTNLISLPIR